MAASYPRGHYDGVAVVELLPDGRNVKLVEDFDYVDAASKRWDVPVGAEVDGASIPQPRWTLVGGPFEGKYRNASIVHDWYCDIRTRPWEEVHRMFFEAMLASKVAITRVRLMYGGVRLGGPRWTTTMVRNNNLLADRLTSRATSHRTFRFETVGIPHVSDTSFEERVYRYPFDERDLDTLRSRLGSRRLALPAIDSLVDELLADRPQITVA